jgi:hypothetical protein
MQELGLWEGPGAYYRITPGKASESYITSLGPISTVHPGSPYDVHYAIAHFLVLSAVARATGRALILPRLTHMTRWNYFWEVRFKVG